MPIYSEVFSDNEILKIVSGKYEKILLLGCGACMNESLSYLHDIPLTVKNDTVPFAVTEELIRLNRMLCGLGFDSRYECLPEGSNSRCMINPTKPLYLPSLNPRPDVILSMSCPSGVFGLKYVLQDIPIIRITHQKGFLFYVYRTESDKSRTLLKEKSRVMTYIKE